MMDPIVNEVEKSYGDRIAFVYADLDEPSGREKARQASVRAVPTVLLFNADGQRVDSIVGSHQRGALERRLDALLAANEP